MRLVKASDVQKLTGLTGDQLREWTIRRGLIEPDTKPHGPGTRALFSWQTVLLLRIAVVLKDRFHIELQSQKPFFANLSLQLAQTSFPALRGKVVLLHSGSDAALFALEEIRHFRGEFLSIWLDPHLDILSNGFGNIEPLRQLPLFPVLAVS